MSEKKRSRRRKEEYTGPGGVQKEVEKPSKEEYAIAKWMKKNVRTKKTKFLSHNVEYFTASKALDALMKSHFAEGDNCLFPSRESAVEYLDVMLEHKFFHRAKKVPVYLDELKSGGNSNSGGAGGKVSTKKNGEKQEAGSKKEKETKDEKDDEKEKEKEKLTDHDSHVEGTSDDVASKEKRKRKIRLEMHPEQLFVDGSEAYVWIYDPVPIHYWIYGTILVLGAIVICMFPLWPPILRKGVYYLSIAAAGFLVFIFALTILRLIIFVILWLLSRGKLYFWIFPNLTEDVGFFASFWPLYEYEYRTKEQKGKSSKKQKKKKKDKDSDAEDETTTAGGLQPEIIENIKEHDTADDVVQDLHGENDSVESGENNKVDNSADYKETNTISESESEGSRSSTGKDFEMVDPTEVDTS
ncbi:unnamed protein product [Hermetia illucens]|uniref:Translocation protein SEC62 n=1 Tax=Hermetia illucens TaxID=343691 RepID=A0A7R8USR0_HERIL|nr:translocation protein SEC62 isoform X2 [Hermetia illucens]CAD7086030.1 unnamed protein product [Hermetia illucens]